MIGRGCSLKLDGLERGGVDALERGGGSALMRFIESTVIASCSCARNEGWRTIGCAERSTHGCPGGPGSVDQPGIRHIGATFLRVARLQ